MDLDAVRTFVAVTDAGRFQEAAAELDVTQQAVSKRVAALERTLGVRLFTRSGRGAKLTIDGQAFLPHARALLLAAQRALDSVRPGRRALRVDVIGSRLAPALLMREFHRGNPDVELDIVALYDADTAIGAIRAGTLDVSFRAATIGALPDIDAIRVSDEPVQLLTGPKHPLAGARALRPADLVGHRVWMPTLGNGTEWARYYDDLAREFGLTLDATGPDLGLVPLLDVIADSASLATFVGGSTRVLWPSDYDLRRIPLHDPTPVYPHALLWQRDNPHPALITLRDHLLSRHRPADSTWAPAWAV